MMLRTEAVTATYMITALTGIRAALHTAEKKLIENKINSPIKYTLVSNVEVGPHTGLASIQKIADDIVEDFREAYIEA